MARRINPDTLGERLIYIQPAVIEQRLKAFLTGKTLTAEGYQPSERSYLQFVRSEVRSLYGCPLPPNAEWIVRDARWRGASALDAALFFGEMFNLRTMHSIRCGTAASADTHAKRGDSTEIEAPSPMSGAVDAEGSETPE